MRTTVFKYLGVLLGSFSITMLPPLAVSWIVNDGQLRPFAFAFYLTLGLGVLLWWPLRNTKAELRFRDGFLIVVLFWTVLSVMGALPLLLLESPSLSWVDALFESMSDRKSVV